MSKRNIKYQIIEVKVNAAGDSVKFASASDKFYQNITGIAINVPDDAALPGSKLQLKIAGEEIFPEGFEARLIATSMDVAPENKFYAGTPANPLREEAAGSTVEGVFTDGAVAGIAYPYTAIIIMRLENISNQN